MSDKTFHLTIVCDRSGSMESVRTGAEKGINDWIDEQREGDGECTLMLIDFDAPSGWMTAETEVSAADSWYRLHYRGDIADAPKYELRPRGGTALYDAVGRAIVDTREWLESEGRDDVHVMFVVQTDGGENGSREWKLEALKKMIDDAGWDFSFLGAGTDAWGGGAALGIRTHAVAHSAEAIGSSYSGHSHTMSAVRSGTAKSITDFYAKDEDESTE